jgi:protein-tyrosine phosphatase
VGHPRPAAGHRVPRGQGQRQNGAQTAGSARSRRQLLRRPDRGAAYERFAIPDCGVVEDTEYDRILAHIRAELDAGKVVLAHCWGGKGRTGTVIGAWLIDHEGLGYPEVLDRMRDLRQGTRKADHPVPDTEEQAAVLRRRAQRSQREGA